MENQIIVKFLNLNNVAKELENIGFDSSYIHHAIDKNNSKTIKVSNLKPQEATILKQSALSLGFDAAVHRGVLDCSVEKSDAILTGSLVHFSKLCDSLEKQPFKMKIVAKNIKELLYKKLQPMKIGSKVFNWERPYLMGILNVTPDSFSDGGSYFNLNDALKHFNKLVEDGADIIDIGAESTRPNHQILDTKEEIKRLKPVIKAVREQHLDVVISVDTRNIETAKMALDMGANLINDVGFDGFNQNMIDFVNANNVPYVLMHNLRVREALIDNVYVDLKNQLEQITAPVIVDIGIGFGKTVEQNFELINRVGEFNGLGAPILVGHSRKSYLSKTFDYSITELDNATLALSIKMALDGVNILRVHDVKQHKLAFDVISKIN